MSRRDIVVIGASAGGVEALLRLVRGLPATFPASVFITLHVPADATSVLPQILSRAGPLPAVHPLEGEEFVKGRLYIAPPDHHLFLTKHRIRLSRGPRENGNRPAVDPMFRSAAVMFRNRVIGVVLTGSLDDGTAGARAVHRHGGVVVVQDPAEALFPSMPQSVVDHAAVDCIVSLKDLASTLVRLTSEEVADVPEDTMSDDVAENKLSDGNVRMIENVDDHPGEPSTFGCPDCGGVLWELKDGEFTRFRCRVGHGWTGEALLAQQATNLDDALWIALRTLEERADLSRQMSKRYETRGVESMATRFRRQAEDCEARARVVRDTLLIRG
jgi:two-component system chemotaxis response regulator CheB